jgi:hypothetical protein
MFSRRQFVTSIAKFVVGVRYSSYVKRINAPKTIYLDSVYLAGYPFYMADEVLDELSPGQSLNLKFEPENKYDSRAIEVYTNRWEKLGYIPRKKIYSQIILKNKM